MPGAQGVPEHPPEVRNEGRERPRRSLGDLFSPHSLDQVIERHCRTRFDAQQSQHRSLFRAADGKDLALIGERLDGSEQLDPHSPMILSRIRPERVIVGRYRSDDR